MEDEIIIIWIIIILIFIGIFFMAPQNTVFGIDIGCNQTSASMMSKYMFGIC